MSNRRRRSPEQMLLLVSCLFFLSGATALSAEVVLNKLLTYVFGSSHLATSTVLAAYMAGLSAGAFLFGKRASSLSRPVAAYAWLELFIGIFYAALPFLFGPFQRAAISLSSPLAFSPLLLTICRFSLSFGLVFLPTFMMGGTLPTLISAFPKDRAVGQRLPLLYAFNTLGAAVGTLATSYLVLPRLGLDGALYGCAAINVGICLLSLFIPSERAPLPEAPPAPTQAEPEMSLFLPARVALMLALAQGALAFALEVVWFHLIGTVIGVTTYAFALMLFSILLGIGLGSLLLTRLLRNRARAPLFIFLWAMVLVSFSVAFASAGWDRFPIVIAETASLRESGHFWAREGIRLAYCLVMLLPTTLALGLSLPALAASVRAKDVGHWVGRLFASNTLGTIVGSLGTGFFLLGSIGSERILKGASCAALLLACSAFLLAKRQGDVRVFRFQTLALGLATLLSCSFLFFSSPWDTLRLTMGSHYYWATEIVEGSRVDWLREDAQSGFITVVVDPNGKKTLRTNGKYEGNNEPAEFQDLFALLGSLYLHAYDRAVLVGLGPARTLSVMHAMPFHHIEAVEYSPAIIAAAKEQFSEFSRAPLEDSARVTLFCDDGRNHIQLSERSYDYVAVAISGAAFAGVGNIYSRDFFQVVSKKLAPDGVFMLWIQLHHVFPSDVRSVVYTLRSVFPHVHFYTDPWQSQGFLLASLSPLTISPELVRSLDVAPKISGVLTQHGLGSALDLVERSVFTTEDELREFFESPMLSPAPVLLTDLAPRFEYATPYSLANSLHIFDFRSLSKKTLPIFSPPLDDEEHALLQARRCYASGDKPCALAAYRRARTASNSDLYDGLIQTLEREVNDAR